MSDLVNDRGIGFVLQETNGHCICMWQLPKKEG